MQWHRREEGDINCDVRHLQRKGQIREARNTFFGSEIATTRTCPTCKGHGDVPKESCAECRGEGALKKQEEVHVVIPAGIENGEMIRMPGTRRGASRRASRGFVCQNPCQNDKLFTREEKNLVTALSIKLTDALLGGEYKIQTLDGETRLNIPQGITQGEFLRIRGREFRTAATRAATSLVRIDIVFPKKLARRERGCWKKLRQEGV